MIMENKIIDSQHKGKITITILKFTVTLHTYDKLKTTFKQTADKFMFNNAFNDSPNLSSFTFISKRM